LLNSNKSPNGSLLLIILGNGASHKIVNHPLYKQRGHLYFGLTGQTTIKIDGLLDAGFLNALNADGTATSLQLTLGNRFNFSENWFGDLSLNVTQVGKATLTDGDDVKQDFKATNLTSMSFAVGSRF
jgi:opacity protein-like surface antigen